MRRANTERAATASAAGYRVRRPFRSDADELGQVHLTVWWRAYASILSADYLASLTLAGSISHWREILAAHEADPSGRLVGLAPDGSIVGMMAWGASRDADPVIADELWAIDILDVHHGTGLADLLLLSSIGSVSPQMLWVLDANRRAQGFYRRHGFRDQGARQHHDLFDADLLLMTRGEERTVRAPRATPSLN